MREGSLERGYSGSELVILVDGGLSITARSSRKASAEDSEGAGRCCGYIYVVATLAGHCFDLGVTALTAQWGLDKYLASVKAVEVWKAVVATVRNVGYVVDLLYDRRALCLNTAMEEGAADFTIAFCTLIRKSERNVLEALPRPIHGALKVEQRAYEARCMDHAGHSLISRS